LLIGLLRALSRALGKNLLAFSGPAQSSKVRLLSFPPRRSSSARN
jgi:hypothetical protein